MEIFDYEGRYFSSCGHRCSCTEYAKKIKDVKNVKGMLRKISGSKPKFFFFDKVNKERNGRRI